MDLYTLKGRIYKILLVDQKKENFRKQEFILMVTNPTDKGTFVEYLRMQCINDKINLLANANVGEQVVCRFKISGRKLGKGDDESFYTNLDIESLTIINRASDIIEDEKKFISEKKKNNLPGLDDDDDFNSDFNKSDSITDIKDDLPF
jgi:hypothetical protein